MSQFFRIEKPKNARIVEVPWVEKRIQGDRICDIGCGETKFALYLSKKGYQVYGIDFSSYNYEKEKYPNFKFYQLDVTEDIPFPENFFDTVIAISTIEHVGLGFYKDPVKKNGDLIAMRQIKRVMKEDGILLLTTEFGRHNLISYAKVKPFYRVYDIQDIKNLFSGLEILEKQTYKKDKGNWVACQLSGINETFWEEGLTQGVICIKASI